MDSLDARDERLQLPLAAPRGGLSPAHLHRALATIEGRLAEAIPVRELAASLPMSPFHFARAFKVSVGTTPHRYMLELRIERAKARLAHGNAPVAEISAALGFKTPSHFSSVFRQLVGETPVRYRLAAQGASMPA